MRTRYWQLKALCEAVLSIVCLYHVPAQESRCLAIIPSFHDRLRTSGAEGPVQLSRQRFVVFVYPNAAAVYSEADFVNTSSETFVQEFALPSTGHNENGNAPGGRISTGILNVQLQVQGKRIAPDFIKDGIEDWYTIRTPLAPGEQQNVQALFWAQTSLADLDSLPGLDTVEIPDGRRGFMCDLAHGATWNSAISTIHIEVVLMQDLNIDPGSVSADPNTYEVQDSTFSWNLYNVEPSPDDNLFVWYSGIENHKPEYNTMAKLSGYIVKTVYDNLLTYARMRDEE